MANKNRHSSEATDAVLEAKLRFLEIAEEDGVWTPQEQATLEAIDTALLQCETHDTAVGLVLQALHRLPDGPNQPMRTRLVEVEQRWAEHTMTYGDDSAVTKRHLVDWQENKAA